MDLDIRWIPVFAVPSGDVVVTYAGAVSVNGELAAGDLYSRVILDFSGFEFGGVGAQDFDFTLDSDSNVPEPATGLLVALLSLALVASQRSRNRAG